MSLHLQRNKLPSNFPNGLIRHHNNESVCEINALYGKVKCHLQRSGLLKMPNTRIVSEMCQALYFNLALLIDMK